MRILVIGAAGMLGRKLVERLARDGRLGPEPISHLSLVDLGVAEPPGDAGFAVDSTVADLAEPGVEKGYRVNLDATRMLLDAIRAGDRDYRPRVVYSSSIAVFGPPFPDVIDDDPGPTPATRY